MRQKWIVGLGGGKATFGGQMPGDAVSSTPVVQLTCSSCGSAGYSKGGGIAIIRSPQTNRPDQVLVDVFLRVASP